MALPPNPVISDLLVVMRQTDRQRDDCLKLCCVVLPPNPDLLVYDLWLLV